MITLYTFDGRLSIKTSIWTNNDKIYFHSRTKLLNSIWKFNFIHKIKLFAWKLIRGKIPIRRNLKYIGMDINRSCPFCQNHLEDMSHHFKRCCFVQ